MANSELKECPCSNITIMQLFHELKQRYPKIPDHIVSKVIEQNFHNKAACETILQRESYHYLQSYPGALISGTPRNQNESLTKQCSRTETPKSTGRICGAVEDASKKEESQGIISASKRRNFSLCSRTISDKVNGCTRLSHYVERKNVEAQRKDKIENVEFDKNAEEIGERNTDSAESDQLLDSSSSSLRTCLGSLTEEEEESKAHDGVLSDNSAVITDRTSGSGCDSDLETKYNFMRSRSSSDLSSLKDEREAEIRRWEIENNERKSAVVSGIISSSSESPLPHNYEVAVEYSMLPIPKNGRINRDPTKSFTSVNFYLRPPSSEPQPPIQIQTGQSLTYTTSTFDPKKGYQSQMQIRIDPGGGSTFSACRTYISTPHLRCSSKSSNCTYHFPGSHRCQSSHHLRELLKKQKERKDLLARELRGEKEKLRCMKNEVRLLKLAIGERPNPHLIPKLKTDIARLRTECERLTAAIDVYSDSQSNIPLGETDEEFYRNIYTGQRFEREESWSCELCTFRNHPLLIKCEECGMPRLSLGTSVKDDTYRLSNVFSNNNNPSFFSSAGTSASASLITAPLREQ